MGHDTQDVLLHPESW